MVLRKKARNWYRKLAKKRKINKKRISKRKMEMKMKNQNNTKEIVMIQGRYENFLCSIKMSKKTLKLTLNSIRENFTLLSNQLH